MEGEKGRINAQRIRRVVPDVDASGVYLCGPPPMMTEILKALATMNLPASAIHWERFAL